MIKNNVKHFIMSVPLKSVFASHLEAQKIIDLGLLCFLTLFGVLWAGLVWNKSPN